MAFQEKREQYEHAMIDLSDNTLTEYCRDGLSVYSLEEILRRWNGVPDIVVTIERRVGLPQTEER